MSEFSKIQYYDLRLEEKKGRLPEIVGREEEMARMTRVTERHTHNNCLVVGASGIGKTSLVRGWAKNLAAKNSPPLIEFKAESFNALTSLAIPAGRFKEVLETLPPSVVILDDFGGLIYNKSAALTILFPLIKSLAESRRIKLILVMESKEYEWLLREQYNFLRSFEIIFLRPQEKKEQKQILERAVSKFGDSAIVKDEHLDLILDLTLRFGSLGELPASAVSILDEALAAAKLREPAFLQEEDIYRVVADKTGIPLEQLLASEKEMLKNLEADMERAIIGQKQALREITQTITRAKLGLKNPHRPLGSFLALGPSGVGKTETAKLLAQKVFGKKKNFIRLDMSEFGEAHTAARLLGAPAGYIGYDTGGGLTNAVKNEPYSMILLDEIEKAHPKIFDVFLQILDDGRLTSGQGETIDFTQTILMATSNLAVDAIIESYQQNESIHSDEFFQNKLLPILTKAFRLEFLNRFDAILIFNPLTENDLLKIAELEIKKVESRAAKHKIKFRIDPEILIPKIKSLADPRFGARPVKRFIETTCENLITQKLLA